MFKRLFFFFLCAKLLVCAFHVAVFADVVQPNIVVILVDDLGWGDLSCYCGPNIKTPHIDTLARDGMQFTKFRTNSSACSPSRAALLSGLYPDRAGVPGVIRTHEPESRGCHLQRIRKNNPLLQCLVMVPL